MRLLSIRELYLWSRSEINPPSLAPVRTSCRRLVYTIRGERYVRARNPRPPFFMADEGALEQPYLGR
jgi:hypothetical protein